MKFCGAVLIAQKQPLELMDLELPPLKLGQVLVRVLTSGICGSQLGEIDGIKGPDRYLPHLLGHEGCGEVLEVGEGVRTVNPGDRVVLHWRKGAGLESVPAVYRGPSGPVNAGWVTTFQEYTVVSENRVTAIPADFDPAQAALLGCAVTTGFGTVCNDAQLKIGETVVILGSGGVGLAATMAARLAGGKPIIATDIYPNRLDRAREVGATHTINAAEENTEQRILDLTSGRGADVVIENTGVPTVIEAAWRSTAPTGRLVLVGVPPAGSVAAFDTLPLHFSKRLLGSHGGGGEPNHEISRYIRLTTDAGCNLKTLIGAKYTLPAINSAVVNLKTGVSTGRPLIDLSVS